MIYAGMNTGIQDAHNLAWKLASLVKGIAPSSILHTYDTERRPVLLLFFSCTWVAPGSQHPPIHNFLFFYLSRNWSFILFPVVPIMFLLKLRHFDEFYFVAVRLPFSILSLVFRTSEQPWQCLLHLVSIQLLQTQVKPTLFVDLILFLFSFDRLLINLSFKSHLSKKKKKSFFQIPETQQLPYWLITYMYYHPAFPPFFPFAFGWFCSTSSYHQWHWFHFTFWTTEGSFGWNLHYRSCTGLRISFE